MVFPDRWIPFFDPVFYITYLNWNRFHSYRRSLCESPTEPLTKETETMFVQKFLFVLVPHPTRFQQTVRKSNQMSYCDQSLTDMGQLGIPHTVKCR